MHHPSIKFPGVLLHSSCFSFYIVLIMAEPLKPRKYSGRLLHYIFKIGDRPKNIQFFREVLGMKVFNTIENKSFLSSL